MATVAEVLKRYGVSLTEADVALELGRLLHGMTAPAAAPVTRGEIDYLGENAGPGAVRVIDDWEPLTERAERAGDTARAVEELVAGSVGVEDAAALLGVDRSRISHRLTAGALYAVTVGSRRRIPTWQFHAGRELPGLAHVVQAIPAGAHPLDVSAVMVTPQDELAGRAPTTHLAGGGDPAPVADLVAELGLW